MDENAGEVLSRTELKVRPLLKLELYADAGPIHMIALIATMQNTHDQQRTEKAVYFEQNRTS